MVDFLLMIICDEDGWLVVDLDGDGDDEFEEVEAVWDDE